jgi:CO dehydrogenase flavoprotein C-terminal domain
MPWHRTASIVTSGVADMANRLQAALSVLREDVAVAEDAPGGMGAYRSALTRSLLFKFLVTCGIELLAQGERDTAAPAHLSWVDGEARSAMSECERAPMRGVQFHADATPSKIVGQPVKHRAADLQARLRCVLETTLPLRRHAWEFLASGSRFRCDNRSCSPGDPRSPLPSLSKARRTACR